MKELSLNILDVAKNSVSAGATKIEILLDEDSQGWLKLCIKDDGCGMSEQTLKGVTDPFYTTRTTRKVGMGLPLLRLAAEQTGGALDLKSSVDAVKHGTVLCASFNTKNIDCMPLGDIVSTVCILIAGSPEIDFIFSHKTEDCSVYLDTSELRAVLGDVSLSEPEVGIWISEYLKEQYENR